MSDAMRSVWRSWSKEVDGIGGENSVGENNWKMQMGKTEIILAVLVMLLLALNLLSIIFMIVFTR